MATTPPASPASPAGDEKPASAPATSVKADSAPQPAPEPEGEPEDLRATLIPMEHPDNGSCDLYETNKVGHILVPASEAHQMVAHGFVVVPDGKR